VSGRDPVRELERQVERGTRYIHTALTEQTIRANETEAMVHGLVDLLIEGGFVDPESLLRASESARAEAAASGEVGAFDVALRVDPDAPAPDVAVDCDARLPVCQAVCCRLRFALSADEIESGAMKWDLGRPYLNRQGGDGYCHQIDAATLRCGVYGCRPGPCRGYSCAGDGRIWTDFERMELNHEWIAAHLDGPETALVELVVTRR
jgi:Fe-S-cluster containining protein